MREKAICRRSLGFLLRPGGVPAPAGFGPSKGILLLCAFFSGLAALVYEVVWIHRFGFVFGATAPAASVVIAVFLGGLAVGSAWVGHESARLTRPFRVFALLQVLLGLFAFAFPRLAAWGDAAYGVLGISLGGSLAAATAVRSLLAVAILALPATLLGGTLPLLLRCGAARGVGAGRINGIHTIGAAVGGFLAGFVLLERCGVRDAGFCAGAVNLATGALAWGSAARREAQATPDERMAWCAPADPSAWGTSAGRMAVAGFALSGFLGMAYEMLLLRFFVLLFRDTMPLYAGTISIFIFWLGAGSAFGDIWLRHARRPLTALGFVSLGIGGAALLACYLPLAAHRWLVPADQPDPWRMLGFLSVFLAPLTFALGLVFPLVARVVAADPVSIGKRLGMACAWNTAGALAGALAPSFLLVPALGMGGTLALLVCANAAWGVVMGAREPGLRFRVSAAGTALAAVAILLATAWPLPLTAFQRLVAPADTILEVREGVLGASAITRAGRGGFELWSDSIVIGKTRNGSFFGSGFIPMLARRTVPARVLSLACGGGLSTSGVRLFPEVQRIDCVDLSRENVEVALAHFPEAAALRQDPRVRFFYDDARDYLRCHEMAYDLMLVEATPPMYSFRNAFLFTQEFYRSAARRLTPGGWFVQVLPLDQMSGAESRGVLRTFASVFPECAMWFMGGPDVALIGSDTPVSLDYEEIVRRLARPDVARVLREKLRIANYHRPGNLVSGYLLDTPDFRAVAAGGTIYTEDRLGLLFSRGADGTKSMAARIHEQLTPWARLAAHFSDPTALARLSGDPALFVRLVEDRRQFFAANLYGPNAIYPAMLDYIEQHALDKPRARAWLLEQLRLQGRDAEAADLLQRMKK